MPCFYDDLVVTNWDKIIDRYSSYIDSDSVGQTLCIFKGDSDEARWIEQHILTDIEAYTGLTHKVKVAVLGGLCANNTLREHIDGHFPPPADACNWSLNIPIKNYEKCEMRWYAGEYEHIINPKPFDATSIFVADEMQKVLPKWTGNRYLEDSKFISTPTIVKINTPHEVVNYSNKTRVFLAIRFTPDINKTVA